MPSIYLLDLDKPTTIEFVATLNSIFRDTAQAPRPRLVNGRIDRDTYGIAIDTAGNTAARLLCEAYDGVRLLEVVR